MSKQRYPEEFKSKAVKQIAQKGANDSASQAINA